MGSADKDIVKGSEASASNYVGSGNNPLNLKCRLWYRQSTDNDNEVLSEVTLTNIINQTPIRWRPGPSASPSRDGHPLWISFAKTGEATEFNNFKACIVTLRFKRTKPHGSGGE